MPAHVNTAAFGPAQTTPVWGAPFYGSGTPTRTVPGTPQPPLGMGLGDAASDAAAATTAALAAPSLSGLALGYGGVATGGAVTGYLASGGTARGAGIGALVHATLLSFGYAFVGRTRFPTAWTVGFAVAGLAAASGVGYLFLKARRR